MLKVSGCLALCSLLVTVATAAAADRLYVGGYGGGAPISFVNLDGSGGGDVFNGLIDNETFGEGIDAAAGRIYWAEDSGNRIAFGDLDGFGGATLNTSGATTTNPEGFAIDPVARRVYWSGANKISFARMDGSGGGDLTTTGATVNDPEGVAIDPTGGRIYWANYLADKISFAKLDGTGGGGDLVTTGAPVAHPEGLTIDVASGRIYWTNQTGGTIGFARLDGSGGGGTLSMAGGSAVNPIGLAIDHAANRVYWTGTNNKVSYANLDGTGGGGDINTAGATLNGAIMPVLLKAPAPATAPAISGATTVGSVLACSQGTWAPDDPGAFLFRVARSFAYQWSLNGTDIAGATGSSYTTFAAGDYRCTVTAANAAGGTGQTSAPLTVTAPAGPPPPAKPVLSALHATRTVFSTSKGSRRRGTTFSFTLDQPATVKIVIRQATGARRVTGTLTRTGKAGANRLAFSGRIGGRALQPGRYRAAFTPSTTAGAGAARTLAFRIVRR